MPPICSAPPGTAAALSWSLELSPESATGSQLGLLGLPQTPGSETLFWVPPPSQIQVQPSPRTLSFISQLPSQSSGLLGDSARIRTLGKGQSSGPHWTESLEFPMFHKVAGLSRPSYDLEGNDRVTVCSPQVYWKPE